MECKYHTVFIPKYRKKAIFGQIKQELGEVFHSLSQQRECVIEEGHMMPDHVHMLISIPPKYSVAQVVGFIKGKGAIHIARRYMGRKQNFAGQSFWARGYFVSTVGRDEDVISLHYSQILLRPCLFLCPHQIPHHSSVSMATDSFFGIRCKQRPCAIITAIHE